MCDIPACVVCSFPSRENSSSAFFGPLRRTTSKGLPLMRPGRVNRGWGERWGGVSGGGGDGGG